MGQDRPRPAARRGGLLLDTTIALPLLTAYALASHAPRPLKRLYDRRDAFMAALVDEYKKSGRAADAGPAPGARAAGA